MNVPAVICLSVSVYAASAVPFLLLANVEHLTPRVVREATASARASAVLTAAAFVLLLSASEGADHDV